MATPTGPKRMSRQNLYEKVWSKAVTLVAAEFGLSDNGLRKICVRLHIPVPPRGYWAMVASGRNMKRKRLPKRPKDCPNDVWLQVRPAREPLADHAVVFESEADRIAAVEQGDEHRLAVPATLSEPHELVVKTQKALACRRPTEAGFYRLTGSDLLDLHVSTSALDRTLRIYDTLIKALESRGHNVTLVSEQPKEETRRGHGVPQQAPSPTYRICAIVLGESMALSIAEKRLSEKRWEKNAWGGGSYVHVPLPTGKLTLSIDAGDTGVRANWSDTATQDVEMRLNACVASLVRIADARIRNRFLAKFEARKQRRAERIAKREQAQAERRQKARAREREHRHRKAADLEQRLAKWRNACTLLSFADAVAERYQAKPEDIAQGRSRLGRWIRWVRAQALQLDQDAFATPWKPINAKKTQASHEYEDGVDDPACQTMPSAPPSPGDRFSGYNFWQRRHIFNSMHGRR